PSLQCAARLPTMEIGQGGAVTNRASNALSAISLQLSNAIKWSNLSLIGNSPVAKLTIFAPFVGYFIIFNGYIQEYLALAFPLADGPEAQSFIDALHARRFYLLYFGLLLLGLG